MCGLALCRLIPGNLLAYFLYRHIALCCSDSDKFLDGTANVEDSEGQT